MTGEEFTRVYGDRALRYRINRLCASRSRRAEIRKEYRQEAWLWIGLAPGGQDTDYYASIAFRAIRSAYRQNRKDPLGRQDLTELIEARYYTMSHLLGLAQYTNHSMSTPPQEAERYDPRHPGFE